MSKKPLEMLEDIKKFVLNLSSESEKETEEVKAEEVSEQVEVTEEVVNEEVEVKTEEIQEEPKFVTTADFETAMNELKSLFSKQYESFKAEKENLETKNLELSKQLEEKPDAEKIVTAPIEKTELSATTPKGRLYQFLNSKK